MKNKILNLLLIGSIVSSVFLVGCDKDDDNNNSSGGVSNPPTNGATGTFTDSRDSKTYKWVKIGEQVWMAENLNYTGSGIQHIIYDDEWVNNSDYDGWCYYEYNENYGSNTYGALYQWEAAKKACPSGWHLPTDEEWTELENYLKENSYSYNGVVGSSKIAKSLATYYGWEESTSLGAVGNSDYSEMRNKTGFSALPSGSHYNNGEFLDLGYYGFWWSATEHSSHDAYGRNLYYGNTVVNHIKYNKLYGFSVRCVRD